MVADTGLASVGEVYLTPGGDESSDGSGAARPPPSWPEGRYVFETPADRSLGAPGWFAFTFLSTAIAVRDVAP
jgi:hypothetical protein